MRVAAAPAASAKGKAKAKAGPKDGGVPAQPLPSFAVFNMDWKVGEGNERLLYRFKELDSKFKIPKLLPQVPRAGQHADGE